MLCNIAKSKGPNLVNGVEDVGEVVSEAGGGGEDGEKLMLCCLGSFGSKQTERQMDIGDSRVALTSENYLTYHSRLCCAPWRFTVKI